MKNKKRLGSKRGLKTLTMDKRMINGSMLRAAELAIAFSHTRPSGRDFNTVCYDSKQGYIMMGENIAAGQTSSKSAMTSWMNSQGHKENILKTFTVTVKGSSLAKVSWGKCRRSSKTVLLQWKKVKGATAYEIYRYKNKKWVKVTTTGKTSYKYKNAPKNGSYKVRALKKSGNKKIYGSFSAVKKIR